jgi:hypothetical protein
MKLPKSSKFLHSSLSPVITSFENCESNIARGTDYRGLHVQKRSWQRELASRKLTKLKILVFAQINKILKEEKHAYRDFSNT